MRLLSTNIVPSPVFPEFRRLVAEIAVESRDTILTYNFDFPADLEADLSADGDPWAVLMLPLACYFGETLHIDRPLDPLLLENLHGLQNVWASWYPEIKPIEIRAQSLRPRAAQPDAAKKTIACFSGGVDSLFTFYRHKDELIGNGHGLIDEFLCIGGLMTSMEDMPALRDEFSKRAERWGRRLVPVLIDFRYGKHAIDTPYTVAFGEWWENLSHAAAIATPVHLFARRYKEFLIPSSFAYDELIPWGSHILTDPLLSASTLSVVHDGAVYPRFERTAFIAQFDEALEILHVCGQDLQKGNCSVCEKCLRTMAMLDLVGARSRAKTFDWSKYSMERLGSIWFTTKPAAFKNKLSFCLQIIREAQKRGRADMAAAAQRSIDYSTRKRFVLGLINSNPLSRGAWGAARLIRGAVRHGRATSVGSSARQARA